MMRRRSWEHPWAVALLILLCLAAPVHGLAQERTVSLEEAMALALERDPAAVAAQAAVSTSAAGRREAWGAMLPTVTLDATYADAGGRLTGTTPGGIPGESYGARLVAEYEIFGGGRRVAELRGSSSELGASRALAREARAETTLRTAEIFFAAAAARDLELVAAGRQERALQQLEFARTRFELGTATASDVLRAEIEVGNAELELIDARAALRRSALELGRQVGEAAVYPELGVLPSRAPDLGATEVLVEQAMRSSPRVLAASAVLDGRRADRLTAYTHYLPSLRFEGGYDWAAPDFPPSERGWSVGLVASLPIFDGLRREGTVARARASETVARADARDATLAVRVAVEAAVQDIVGGDRRVEISDRSVDLAREDLRVQQERYRIGASTILDLQASQVALTDAEAAAVRARTALAVAMARLDAILGEPRTVP